MSLRLYKLPGIGEDILRLCEICDPDLSEPLRTADESAFDILDPIPDFSLVSHAQTTVPPVNAYKRQWQKIEDERWALFEVSRSLAPVSQAKIDLLRCLGVHVTSLEPERIDEYWHGDDLRLRPAWDDKHAAIAAILSGLMLIKISSLFYLVEHSKELHTFIQGKQRYA
jgi:hypothetical protein